MDPIIGQIILWPVAWVPQGWALCDGTLLNINQYQALYSLIGNTYGGNAPTTFAVPDLRGLVPLGSATMTQVGVKGGSATANQTAVGGGMVTLTTANLPAHTHAASFSPSGGSSSVSIAVPAVANPSGASVTDAPGTGVSLSASQNSAPDPITVYSSDAPNTSLKPFSVSVPGGGGTVAVANTGSGTPAAVQVQVPVTVSTMQPSMTMNYIIAIEGMYPSRP